jgi:flagellar biogenesis protein FliO
VALALAACGAFSVASRRYLPQGGAAPLKVVGRANLSPKQAVHLVQVGDRILIVGTGAQGAPTLLGELTDPAEVEPLLTRRTSPPTEADPAIAASRLVHREGGDA